MTKNLLSAIGGTSKQPLKLTEELYQWKLHTELWVRHQGLPFVLPHHPIKTGIKCFMGPIIVSFAWLLILIWANRLENYNPVCLGILYFISTLVVAVWLYPKYYYWIVYKSAYGALVSEGLIVTTWLLTTSFLLYIWHREPLGYFSAFQLFLGLMIVICLLYYGWFFIAFWLIKTMFTSTRHFILFLSVVQPLLAMLLLFNQNTWQLAADPKAIPELIGLIVILGVSYRIFMYIIREENQIPSIRNLCSFLCAILVDFLVGGRKLLSTGKPSNWVEVEDLIEKDTDIKLPDNTEKTLKRVSHLNIGKNELGKFAKFNCRLLVSIDRVRAWLVGVIMGGVFFMIGLVALRHDTVKNWTGDMEETQNSDSMPSADSALDSSFYLSEELVKIALLIAVVSAFQFKVLVWIKDAQEKRCTSELEDEIHQVLAVRKIYLALPEPRFVPSWVPFWQLGDYLCLFCSSVRYSEWWRRRRG